MKIKSDFHSHVSHSSAHQMVEAAREKGLRVLGLSEHIFEMGEARHTLEHLPLDGRACDRVCLRNASRVWRTAMDIRTFNLRI